MKKLLKPMSNPGSITPVAIYSNADKQKLLVFKENKGKSGIYRWTNLLSGKSYIGSSVNLKRRLQIYYNIKHITKNKRYIDKALLKYGYSNFSLEILEYCDPLNVIDREQFYLDLLKPVYNICKTAGSTLGRKLTEEQKIKLLNANIGRKLTKEHKKNISDSLKGRCPWNYGKTWKKKSGAGNSIKGNRNPFFGKTHTEDSIAKSITTRFKLNYNERRFIVIKNIETGKTNKFVSFKKAAIYLATYDTKIARYVKSKKIYKKKYQIYINIENIG
jgi:group I intron endonuclease